MSLHLSHVAKAVTDVEITSDSELHSRQLLISKRKVEEDVLSDSTEPAEKSPRKEIVDLSRYVSTVRLGSNDTPLCDRCQSIDFAAIFDGSTELLRLGVPVADLGALTREQRSSDCPLCFMFASAAFGPYGAEKWPIAKALPRRKNGKASDVWHLRLYSGLRLFHLPLTAKLQKSCTSVVLRIVHCSADDSTTAHVQRQLTENKDLSEEGNFIVEQGSATASYHQQPQYCYEGRVLKTLEIDYQILKDWISECTTHHKRTCRKKREKLPSAKKLIDCAGKAEVISATVGMRYLILSYVWGPQQELEAMPQATLDHRQYLPEKLPRTISDTILVVLSLGYRYLWIDRYCINQDKSSPEWKDQIDKMDNIFEAADVTLIATGGDANTGLPGVSDVPRVPHPSIEVNGAKLVSSLPHLLVYLEGSKWSRRGWTYQEVMLSGRCLFFTVAQVYFVCGRNMEAEAVIKRQPRDISNEKLRAHGDILAPDLFRTKAFYSRQKLDVDMPSLQSHLIEYTGRDLTNQSDALDAFRGILKRSNNTSYWGIPIFSTQSSSSMTDIESMRPHFVDLGFAHGLLWRRSLSSSAMASGTSPSPKRRLDFPSWSWASSPHVIKYDSSMLGDSRTCLTFDHKATFSCPKFEVLLESGRRKSLKDVVLEHRDRQTNILPEISRFLHLNALLAKCTIQLDSNGKACSIQQTHPKLIVYEGDRQDFQIFVDDHDSWKRIIHRTESHEWDLLLLVSKSFDPSGKEFCWWMLLDWVGDTAYRLGVIYTRYEKTHRFAGNQTMIKLG